MPLPDFKFFDDMMRAQQNYQQATQSRLEELLRDYPQAGQPYKPKSNFNSIEDLNKALEKQRKAHPKLPPAERIKQIDTELDIIRGVKPTPKGYKIDATKAKRLMTERRNLQAKL